MKAIRLSRITPIAKGFRVYLGNGYTFEFKSLRSAKAFLATTNNFLTETLVEINFWYKLTHGRYRDNWLLFFHNKPSLKGHTYTDNLKCEKMLRDVADLLEHSFQKSATENGATWVFKNFLTALEYLEQTSLLLLGYHKKRSETAAIYCNRCDDGEYTTMEPVYEETYNDSDE